MKGILFIGVLLALLAAGYLTYERIQNPAESDEAKDMFDMPNIAKEKAENYMKGTQDRYDEAMDAQ